MALATESAGKVRERVRKAISNSTGTTTASVNPYHFFALKAFFLHWAANKGNADLQYVPYSAEDAIVNTGFVIMDAACSLYVWFAKARRTSGTTASWEEIYDAAALGGDSDIIGDEISIHQIRATGQQFLEVWPAGYSAAAGVVLKSVTALEGATESTAANSTDGFFIVGA